jgi:RNA polymerase sigma-70 factor (ECF subfamily)
MSRAVANIDVGALYAQHVDWLRAWLDRRTRCPERSADLAQDTYCRLIERSGDIAIGSPRSYLATLARRLLIDDVRRREVERAILDAFALHGAADEQASPDRIAEATQLLDRLAQMLDRLPTQVCEAFLLRRLEGLSQSEVADRLGISVSTVKRHIAQAYLCCLTIAYAD